MQSHQHSPSTITTGSRWSKNSYTTSDSYNGAGKEQRTDQELVNEHYEEPLNRTFDHLMESMLNELMSDESTETEIPSSTATVDADIDVGVTS